MTRGTAAQAQQRRHSILQLLTKGVRAKEISAALNLSHCYVCNAIRAMGYRSIYANGDEIAKINGMRGIQ